MDVVRLTRILAAHVGRFDCHVNEEDSLVIYIQWAWRPVGTVAGSRFMSDVHIRSLDNAPDYLHPLVGRKFDTKADLLRAIRKVAFLNEARVTLRDSLRDALSELDRTEPPGREPDG